MRKVVLAPGIDSTVQNPSDSVKPEHNKPPSLLKQEADSVSPPPPPDFEERRKMMKLLVRGGGSRSELYKLPPSEKADNDSAVREFLKLIESALQQFCDEQDVVFHLDKVTNCYGFCYANNAVHHLNFEARPQNLTGVAEPSVTLFFAEVMSRYPNPRFITCCRPILPMDRVTEGCLFCRRMPHGSLIIHPISNEIKVDSRFSAGDRTDCSGEYPKMAMSLPGYPPWQLNHGPVVKLYKPPPRDTGVKREQSQEYNTRVRQLSEAVLLDLKNRKGVDLELVQGLKYCTFQLWKYTFHHLNLEAKHQDDVTRKYFAELINDGGADHITFCCVLDAADKVQEICSFCDGSGVIQPQIRLMDRGNVSYVDLELCLKLQSGHGGPPCMIPSPSKFLCH